MLPYEQYISSQAVSTTMSTRLAYNVNQDCWHTWTTKSYGWRRSFIITFIFQALVNIFLRKIKYYNLLDPIISRVLKIYNIIESVITVVKLKIYSVKHKPYNTWNQQQILGNGNKKLRFKQFTRTLCRMLKEIQNITKNTENTDF